MRKLLIVLCLCTAALNKAAAQGIEFLEQPVWSEVLRMAAEQDRMIFMDCYAVWCGPCKALAERVFPQPEVGEFFNARFINVKYDMEKGEGAELYRHYRRYIVGFPTLLLIDKEGNVVHQMAGFQEPDALIAGMRAALEGRSLPALRRRHEAGERDVEFIAEFVAALNSAHLRDDAERVVVDYMQLLPLDSLLTPVNWALVGEYVKDPYSPQFEFVLRRMTQLIWRQGVDGYRLERQLIGAIDRAVGRITDLEPDREGNVPSLVNEPEKVARLRELIAINNLRRAETQRAYLRVHELRLAADWRQVLDAMHHYSAIGAMGYADRFVTQTIRYIAVNVADKAILRRALAMMESIRRANDDSQLHNSGNHDVMIALHRALGNRAEVARWEAEAAEHKRRIDANWQEMLERIDE